MAKRLREHRDAAHDPFCWAFKANRTAGRSADDRVANLATRDQVANVCHLQQRPPRSAMAGVFSGGWPEFVHGGVTFLPETEQTVTLGELVPGEKQC